MAGRSKEGGSAAASSHPPSLSHLLSLHLHLHRRPIPASSHSPLHWRMPFIETLPEGRLPETDVAGMRDFLATMFIPDLHESFYIQIYVASGLIIVMAALIVAILTRRIVNKSAWLVQAYHTPQGIYWIPNAVTSLCVLLLVYTITYVVYSFLVCINFYRNFENAGQFFYWRGCIWSPLWSSAFLCTMGTISAFPDALRLRGRKVGRLQRALLRPQVFNNLMWLAPLLCLGTALVPISLAQKQFNHILPTYRDWQVKASAPGASASELAPEARYLYLEVTRAYYYDSITFAVWAAWAGILLMFFGVIAIHTLLRVRAQVVIAERKNQRAIQTAERTFYLFSSRPNHADPAGAAPQSTPHSKVSSNAAGSSPRTQSDDGETFQGHNRSVAFAAEASPKQSEMPPELMHVAQTETTSVLFPALKIKPGEKLTKVQAAARRSEALGLVYRNLIIQYTAIGLGVISFGFDAGYIAVSTYITARVNNIGVFQESANLVAAWSTVLFGFCIFGALLWRSFDPAFILGAEEEVEEVEMPTAPSSNSASKAPTDVPTPRFADDDDDDGQDDEVDDEVDETVSRRLDEKNRYPNERTTSISSLDTEHLVHKSTPVPKSPASFSSHYNSRKFSQSSKPPPSSKPPAVPTSRPSTGTTPVRYATDYGPIVSAPSQAPSHEAIVEPTLGLGRSKYGGWRDAANN